MKFTEQHRSTEEIIKNIKEILESYVQPAVEQHGGEVNYVNFEQGTLTLQLSGACSGCAGSMQTLQYGIEGMMKHHVPEVVHIEAEHDQHSTVDPFYQYEDFYNYTDYENY